jgi:hypothetical protein
MPDDYEDWIDLYDRDYEDDEDRCAREEREQGENDAYEYANSTRYEKKRDYKSYDESRQKNIVTWLTFSKYAVAMRNNEGFYISGKFKGRLKDGRSVRLIDWLYEEGIRNGTPILQYKVRYDRDEDRLYFLDSVGGADVPF